eukprot:scaffold569_cov165-Amphora_coffeaeformis.AAC.22
MANRNFFVVVVVLGSCSELLSSWCAVMKRRPPGQEHGMHLLRCLGLFPLENAPTRGKKPIAMAKKKVFVLRRWLYAMVGVVAKHSFYSY